MSDSVQIAPRALAIMRNLQDTAAVMAAICRVLDYQNELTVGAIQCYMLSGPGKQDISSLAVVTGLLRRSARPVKATVVGSVVFSGLGSNVRYAAAHEFGVDKEVTIKEHMMRNSIRDRFQVAGLEDVDRFTALRLGVLSRKQASQAAQDSGKYVFAKQSAKQTVKGGQILVKAHQMHMHLPARHIFQRGIQARLDVYGAEISKAIIHQWGGN